MNGHVVYGQALFDSGRYDESQVTFTAALGLDPENLIALRHLGDIARIANDAPAAMGWYTRVLDADPRNQEILAFIEELRLVAPAPVDEPAAAAAVPMSTPVAIETVEIEVQGRPSAGATPIAPMPSAAAAPRRPSLMDVSIDLGALPETAGSGNLNATPVTGTITTVPPPSDSSRRPSAPMPRTTIPGGPPAVVGDTEFGELDFGDSIEVAAPSAPPPRPAGDDQPLEMEIDGPLGLETTDPLPIAEAVQMDSSLGWEMPGDIDLDAAAANPGAMPDESPPVGDTPPVFVTETMAELYLQQGFREEALQVYRQLAEQNPDDQSLRQRIKNLEHGDRASLSLDAVSDELPDFAPGTDSLVPMADAKPAADRAVVPIEDLAPAPAVRAPGRPASPSPAGIVSARAFFARLAARRALRSDGTPPSNGVAAPTPAAQPAVSERGGTIDGLFGGASGGSTDDAIGLALATAVGQGEAGAGIRGKPTTQAASELSIDSVFRGDSSARASGPVSRQSNVLKFDQFFSSDAAAAVGAAGAAGAPQPATPAPPSAASGDSAAPADDAQFQSWLQGLKGK